MPIEDEDRAFDEVVGRIAAKLPNLSTDLIRAEVEAQLAKFDASAVRDFIPVLVEHEVLERLRTGEREVPPPGT